MGRVKNDFSHNSNRANDERRVFVIYNGFASNLRYSTGWTIYIIKITTRGKNKKKVFRSSSVRARFVCFSVPVRGDIMTRVCWFADVGMAGHAKPATQRRWNFNENTTRTLYKFSAKLSPRYGRAFLSICNTRFVGRNRLGIHSYVSFRDVETINSYTNRCLHSEVKHVVVNSFSSNDY